MHSLRFYFGKASSDETASDCPRPKPTFTLEVGKKKRLVGRPRKVVSRAQPLATAAIAPAAAKLVDYSCSSESEGPETESECTKKKSIHRMYSQGQKSKVANYARHHGIRKASRHFGIHHRNVQRWVKSQVAVLKNPGKRVNKKGQGRKITYPPETEEKLLTWTLEKRESQLIPVSTHLIRMKALSLIKESNPNFKASDGWVRKFMKRNNLILRVRTHISQNLPKDLESKIKTFLEEVAKIHDNSDYPYEYI